MKTMKKINVLDAAKKIGVDVKDWEGNCYGVAMAFVKYGIVSGNARYGHYVGEIHPKSIFYAKSGMGFARHGWVELSDGTIVDPTRWAFECVEPYVYIGSNKDYDIGGVSFKNAIRASTPPPAYNATERQITLTLPNSILHLLHLICGEKGTSNVFSISQIFWIGNADPAEFGNHAKAIYDELDRVGEGAVIPIDYYDLVLS